ncbi:hypothetical protein FNV43_RR10048 [Rhamnella rubrinervis]|uniref:Fe2OG dioxygenase domain-containing protein n=1 Tax=Rhamnella rubrinervis TaxID=2594499 RepID=A0A8K0HBL7_9ROSA|nr:hypothetical protein FNV43_RR10048 [Rhamnella rubrinervis]
MEQVLKLPILDLSSPDRSSIANCLRQACIEYGFFYVVNHGVEEELIEQVLDESSKFFSLPSEEKMKLLRKGSAGKRLLSLVALALNLNEDFFETTGALDRPTAVLRPLHYPAGEFGSSDEEILGASAHSDYGMVTLLICREKSKQPLVWEDVPHINGAFIVNIGDMMERWTNCLFRSTLHRVIPCGQERYSLAFFLDPNEDCVVECIESCCNESSPPRFPPIRSGDYLKERLRLIWGS